MIKNSFNIINHIKQKKRCFGTKEYSIKNSICVKCKYNQKCKIIFPKERKLRIEVQHKTFKHFVEER